VIRPSARDLQVVIGPTADSLAREMRDALGAPVAVPAPTPAASASAPADTTLAGALLKALGGAGNLQEAFASCSRLSLHVADDTMVDEPALRALASRGLARPKAGTVHVLLGPDAEPALAGLKALSAALG
jgi:PTS system N-acetylglucosamine-specific IIC component